ncbi:MAG TPA: group II intron reverse transcriptase/maturase [Chitinophagaceae bacterium]|nr:group II intron reverse transcriptase/maturase [Chitinophagaceae bacterium]
MTKSLPISKRMVYNSYLKVVAKDGSAGIDKQSIEGFNENLSDNLYKVWNRMTSGSYFPPPVRTVFIPKKQGGKRPLGIPTVSDRIAQGVVKDHLEPSLETIFHPGSFGYRPGRSAHDALKQCHDNCIKYPWVIDVDIKGFFDNINHDIMLQLLQKHTQEKWVMLYAERWLKAGVEQEDGSIIARTKGTPQGGVISPLFANIYLHHAFDKWMNEVNLQNPFERYADDIVIHCSSKEEAEQLLEKLKERMQQYELELHPEKTKIVYCKNYQRNDKHDNNSFTFLSYSFQPRTIRDKFGRKNRLVVFNAAISQQAMTSIRTKLRSMLRYRWSDKPLEWFAEKLNPKIRGWVNYYMKFNRYKAYNVFYYLNDLIQKWIANKYKIRGSRKVKAKYQLIQAANPEMFYHWKLGIRL